MSDNQEMQFADPAWQPQVTQNGSVEQDTPAPQPSWSPPVEDQASPTDQAEFDYARGYRAQTEHAPRQEAPFSGQAQRPFPQSQQPWYRRLPLWAWILIVVILSSGLGDSVDGPAGSLFSLLLTGLLAFGVWLLFTGRLRINLNGEAQAGETRTFEVQTQPTILINNKAGSLRLRAGQENQVSIITTRRGYLSSQRLDREASIEYKQDSSTNTVSARVNDWKPFGKNAIDFEIVVPPQAHLELTTSMGNISVQNVAGQVNLRSDAGSISATQVTLHGKSRLRTNAGSINFTGDLDVTGSYKLATDLGAINATLTPDSSFSLDAQTDLGTVSTNLPLRQIQRTKVSGQVGL